MFLLDWDMNFDPIKSVKKTFSRGEIGDIMDEDCGICSIPYG